MRSLAIPFEWQDAVIRAAISLKLCTYEDTGAVLAALTTSIPEAPGSGRNWDYRYCWLRDSYFVIQALNRLGATRTMEGYLRYIDHDRRATQARSNCSRSTASAGNRRLQERTVAPRCAGYRGMGPVRVGNLAYLQRQHDVYGAVVLAAAQSFFDERLAHLGDAVPVRSASSASASARSRVLRPAGRGPWEFRGLRARAHVLRGHVLGRRATGCARIAGRLGLQDRAE